MATDYSKLTVQQLKAELAEKGLDQTGKKAELVSRLESSILDDGNDEEEVVDEPENGVLEDDVVEEAEEAEEEKAVEGEEEEEAEEEAKEEENEEENAEEDPTDEVMEEENAQDEQMETSAQAEDDEEQKDKTEEPEDDTEEVVEIIDDTEENAEDEVEVVEDNLGKDEKKDQKAAKGDADKAEKSKDGAKSPGKKDRWVKVVFGKRSKSNHLDCVQLFNQKRKMKDMQATRASHRIRVFPVLLEEVNSPVVKNILKKCSAINMNMHSMIEEDGVTQKVMMVLVFNKESDIEKSITELKEFIPDIMVSTSGYDKFQEKTMVLRTKGTNNMEETTLLIPRLPDRINEDDLWEMFPTAWEIFLIKSHNDQKETGTPKRDSKQKEPSYAYIYFPNLEVSRKATRELGAKPAPADIPNLTLIPLSSLSNPEKYVGKAGKSTNPSTSTSKQASIFSAEPIELSAEKRRQVTPGKQAGAGAKPRANKQAGNAKASPMTMKGRAPQGRNQPRQNRQANQSFSSRGPSYDTQRRSNMSGGRFQGRGGMDAGYDNQGFNQGNFRNQQMQQQQMQMNYMNQQARMASEKEQGLQVLGNLLSSIGGQQAQGNPANALLQMLGGQQQGQQRQSQGGQHQQFDQGHQQFNRGLRSPKRARSPNDRDSVLSKRRRQEMGGRKDTMNKDRRYSGGAAASQRDSYQARTQREVTAATYAPMPGYEAQGTSMSSHGGYGGGSSNRQGNQGSGSGDMYESLDVVSRIVRASKELKDAMHKGGPSQSYDSYNTSQGYSSNQTQRQAEYEGSGNQSYSSDSYNRY